MPPPQLLGKLALVAGQGVVLFLLSRGLFVWVLQALATRSGRQRGGWLVQLVRLPGNLVHELSHAAAFLVCGYRVRRVVPCIFDKAGAGACQPGRPWSPIALPWLATGLAALAPLVSGALVLWAVARWLDIPLATPLSAQHPGSSVLTGLYHTLLALDYREPRTWLFLYLAFTIGAELAPSTSDVLQGIPALLALGVTTAAVLLGAYQLAPDAPLRVHVLQGLSAGLSWLGALWGCGVVTTAVVVVLTFLPASLVRAARG